MALISHKYKFVYIKNKKVAGSSVESFFGQYCVDPNDDYHFNDRISEKISPFGYVGRRLKGNSKLPPHASAKEISSFMGETLFDDYLKFSVIRNPWDRVVSLYYWRTHNEKGENNTTDVLNIKDPLTFEQFMKGSGKKTLMLGGDKVFNDSDNWDLVTINDKPICDFYIRYEDLNEDIKKLCDKLGITNYDLSLLPNHKGGYRKDKRDYRDYYNEETKDIVAQLYKKEIKEWGYKF
jgi:hypothetical protein